MSSRILTTIDFVFENLKEDAIERLDKLEDFIYKEIYLPIKRFVSDLLKDSP